ncbi:MAG: DUF3568 domain-containing protein [Candidatus Omnitrophica bacterium]|nr:DUF3568 domain-containing protein [Candidatus Omnitrophota bacterium]MBU1091170.1 DUF3568 domain-containing protein [Candidatus Omnitrophota bacterium]MBU1906062.1 DUF3568 domain-containing protein [Candidatus Omnitrophota bacterium]
MFRKALVLIFAVSLLVNTYGCVALLAGAAGGAGTAAWLSLKMTQEVNATFQKCMEASKKALRSLNLDITKETVKGDIAQIKSEYADGRVIWIDIRRLSPATSRIEVRVGAKGDKEAASKILNEIVRYL